MCKYREYGTPVNTPSCPNCIPVPLSVSRFHFSALTTIHCQVKLQINMQVVTCEKIKMFGGLSLVPRGNETNETSFPGFPALEREYV